MEKCQSVFGHKFKPRYDIEPPADTLSISTSAGAALRTLELLSRRTYVADVCERCGAVVLRRTGLGEKEG